MSNYHNPVLLQTSVDFLVGNPAATYADVTFGGGGHSGEIMNRLTPQGRLIAFDQDSTSYQNALIDSRFTFVTANFRHLKKFLQYYQSYPVQGILADLGVSSHQFDTPDRGFSYRYAGALDMRMNQASGLSACDIINGYAETQLAKLFYTYGELKNGGKIAAQIVQERQNQIIKTTEQLIEVVSKLLPHGKENKTLSQLFQALRIEVNDEIGALQEFLLQCTDALCPDGRLVVIAYHSLEDRLVKNFMKSGNFEGIIKKDFFGNPLTPFELITRKVIIPDEKEITTNPRARSAKLRVAAKRPTVNS
ncbi:MAG: 16S rRNA (cytosine(1402)-N(4))-methyltransferase RsmH [Bacteroidales bacterium]|jgi:16S rRNA (cytosine1402-N4)-methyltransferase|nr:16S rRNA (cytosine(1402)-N(4))-methyltransferase RsmH [Bacteroidales bacterium]